MSSLEELEANLIRSLKRKQEPAQGEEQRLRQQARLLARKGKHAEAADAYAKLFQHHPDDFDLPLRAAHAFLKADNRDAAATWFLKAAEAYARLHAPAQAAAALRLYHDLKPDEFEGPRRIFRICMQQGESDASLLKFLSSRDRVGHKLRDHDFFAALDPSAFFALLDRMNIVNLKAGEYLMRMGEQATSLYIVATGCLEGYLNIGGQRTSLGRIGAGDTCGEIAYFTGGRRTAEVVALEPSSLLEMPYRLLDELRDSSPDIEKRLEALYRSRMLVKQLSLTGVFDRISPEARLAIAEKMQPASFQAGDVIFQEGQSSQDMYMVRQGKVAINIRTHGSERLLKTIETGGVFGEVAVLLGGRRTATARAVSDCSLMKLSGAEYAHLLASAPELKDILEERKAEQMDETRQFIRQVSRIEGDDTCELLLKEIWGS